MPEKDAPWRIQLFGELKATREGRTVAHFRTRKTGLLLADLAYHLPHPRPRDRLIELFWPNSHTDAARQSLSQSLSSLRRQLEPPGTPDGAVLFGDRLMAGLNPAGVTTDVIEFQAALDRAARAPDREERIRALEAGIALYRGRLLGHCYDEWIFPEQKRWIDLYCGAAGEIAAHYEATGDLSRAIDFTEREVGADRLREASNRDLMRRYAAAGRPADALQQYQALTHLLRDELGVAPSVPTRALAEQIRGRKTGGRDAQAPLPQPDRDATRSSVPGATGFAPRAPGQAGDDSGQPPPPSGEYRIVTALHIASPSLLPSSSTGRLEEEVERVNRALHAMKEVVLRYGGFVVRVREDGIVALFGAREAHEDDAERAIRAALEIRETLDRSGIVVQSGIHTGEVYLAGPTTDGQPDVAALGSALTCASRLQASASPSQILIDRASHRPTRRTFVFLPASVDGSGTKGDGAVFQVERLLPRAEKARGIEGWRAELIGREEELARLRAALRKTLEGRGQIVCVMGQAGVGKSRLVAELKQAALRSSKARGKPRQGTSSETPSPRPLWLEGRCLEMGMASGYWLFADLFRAYLAWHLDDDERSRAKRLATSLRDLVEAELLSMERAEEIGPLLGHLLSVRFGNDWDDRLLNAGPEQIRHQTFLAIRDFFAALARRQPVVLVLEDLHWADSLSLDTISVLMEATAQLPLLLVCVYRPERGRPCVRLGTVAAQKYPDAYVPVELRDLSAAQSRQLVRSLLQTDRLPEWAEMRIMEQSQGNPFFLEEIVWSLIEAGTIVREGEAWKAREAVGDVAAPASVQSVILGRLDPLDGELKRILQVASVMGRVFRRKLLGAIIHDADLDRRLWELEDRGFVYQERVTPEEYSFKHVLIQETIYRSLLNQHRDGYHRKVASAMEAAYGDGLAEFYDELAYHYERSRADEKAVEYLLKAGEKARKAYLNEAAVGYFSRAMNRLDALESESRDVSGKKGRTTRARPEWRLKALDGLGRTYHGIGMEKEAEAHFREAIALGRERRLPPRDLVRLYSCLGDVLFWQSRHEEMARLGEEGLALLSAHGTDAAAESVEAAMMNAIAAMGHWDNDNWAAARDYCDRNARFLLQLPYSEELRPAYFPLVRFCVQSQKDIQEASRWLADMERNARLHHDLRGLGEAHALTGVWILAPTGDLQGALDRSKLALEIFVEIGDAKLESWCLTFLGRLYMQLGDLDQAEDHLKRGLSLSERVGNTKDIAWSYIRIGNIALARGEHDRAIEAYRWAVNLLRQMGIAHPGAVVPLGWTYLLQGKHAEALEQFLVALAGDGVNARVISGLEAAYDDAGAFRALCRRLHDEISPDNPLDQWFLEPIRPDSGFATPGYGPGACDLILDMAAAGPGAIDPAHGSAGPEAGWVWHDPMGDCSYRFHPGLAIHAANERDLWNLNVSAPRLLRPVSGDFATEASTVPVSPDTPIRGGILLWRDPGHFLRLERGIRGADEVTFEGTIGNRGISIGRGNLRTGLPPSIRPLASSGGRIYLRMERRGCRVRALCSDDGERWFTVGQVDFPADGPQWIGIHAIGVIDRGIYHGAYPEGTAIRFESFRLWG